MAAASPTRRPVFDLQPPAISLTPPTSDWKFEEDDALDIVAVTGPHTSKVEPDDWKARLTALLRQTPHAACVGAKRVSADARVHAMGDFVVHPKGFHHLGHGVMGQAYRFAEEVDVIAGGAFVVDRKTFHAVDGAAALTIGHLGGIELGLRLRQAGGRVFAAPQAVATESFTPVPGNEEHQAFVERWGFDWRSPDLDAVKAKYAGQGLLWNASLHSPGMPFEKYEQRGALVWKSYADYEPFRQRAHHLAGAAKQLCPAGELLDVGCGDGLFAHLYARKGIEVVGVDPEPEGVRQAQLMTGEHEYNVPRPTFMVGNGTQLPFDDNRFQAAMMLDVIEHLPNPIALLREVSRVLKPGGQFLVCTPGWGFGMNADPIYHLFEYTVEQLEWQLNATPGFKVVHTGGIGGVYRDVIAVAEKQG